LASSSISGRNLRAISLPAEAHRGATSRPPVSRIPAKHSGSSRSESSRSMTRPLGQDRATRAQPGTARSRTNERRESTMVYVVLGCVMVRRFIIAMVAVLAVFAATVRLPARACALTMPAAQMAACADCCATMKSCVLSKQSQTPSVATTANAQPSTTFIAQPVQSLLVEATVNLPKPDTSPLAIPRDSPPRQAVLCTFLI
jgi:hypothetical protein